MQQELLIEKLLQDAKNKYGKSFKYSVFPQVWPTTALGYNRPGCDVLSIADTIVIYNDVGPAIVYYQSETPAYIVQNPSEQLFTDIKERTLSNKNIYEKF